MAKNSLQVVLFLHAGGDADRSADTLFRSVADRMGLAWRAISREIGAVSAEDFETAARIVAVKADEHRPLLRERFPTRAETIEFWNSGPASIESEVMNLIARILGGGGRGESASAEAAPPPAAKVPKKKPVTLKVGRETAGRRGKGVTTVFDIPLGEAEIRELAATLKQKCGTGGTVKDRRIEIQGDQRERIVAELEKLGYAVKRAGG